MGGTQAQEYSLISGRDWRLNLESYLEPTFCYLFFVPHFCISLLFICLSPLCHTSHWLALSRLALSDSSFTWENKTVLHLLSFYVTLAPCIDSLNPTSSYQRREPDGFRLTKGFTHAPIDFGWSWVLSCNVM